MLKRYGDKAPKESTARADELAAVGDGNGNGAATWRRITDTVLQREQHTARAGALIGTDPRRLCQHPHLPGWVILDNRFYREYSGIEQTASGNGD